MLNWIQAQLTHLSSPLPQFRTDDVLQQLWSAIEGNSTKLQYKYPKYDDYRSNERQKHEIILPVLIFHKLLYDKPNICSFKISRKRNPTSRVMVGLALSLAPLMNGCRGYTTKTSVTTLPLYRQCRASSGESLCYATDDPRRKIPFLGNFEIVWQLDYHNLRFYILFE